jgi:DNA-binding cell septation regulator SpoVG
MESHGGLRMTMRSRGNRVKSLCGHKGVRVAMNKQQTGEWSGLAYPWTRQTRDHVGSRDVQGLNI